MELVEIDSLDAKTPQRCLALLPNRIGAKMKQNSSFGFISEFSLSSCLSLIGSLSGFWEITMDESQQHAILIFLADSMSLATKMYKRTHPITKSLCTTPEEVENHLKASHSTLTGPFSNYNYLGLEVHVCRLSLHSYSIGKGCLLLVLQNPPKICRL